MNEQGPQSNADRVAFMLAANALVDDAGPPGTGLANLFERMAEIARDTGREFRMANDDWQKALGEYHDGNEADAQAAVYRQADSWREVLAKRWMLSVLAKRIHHELERACLQTPAFSAISGITYLDDGDVESITLTKG